jgi:hypothetical protein
MLKSSTPSPTYLTWYIGSIQRLQMRTNHQPIIDHIKV